MQRLPSMRALQVFEAFGRLGSATAAAEELAVTVGAVSQQLRKIEAEMGVRLIERSGPMIALTARGRAFHADVTAAFDGLRLAHDRVRTGRSNLSLTLSCLPSLATKWIGGPLLDWRSDHPGANLRLVGDDAEPVLDGREIDFRLSYGVLVTRHRHRINLFTDWVVPACAPSLLDRYPVREPAAILAAPLLAITWSSGQGAPPGWAEWAARIGADLRREPGDMGFSLSSAAIEAAINGRGFVLAQMAMAGEDIRAGRLVVPFDIRLPLSQPYALAWDPAALEKPDGPALRAWIQALSRRQQALSTPAGV